jgi:hypothetical protein
LLQEPQFVASVSSCAQALPHAVSPPPQVAEQTPAEQNGVAPPQTVPHAPQLLGSEAVLTHASPQAVSPPWQEQLPAEQAWPAPHFLRHMPQLLISVSGSIQNSPSLP